ncbi:Metal-dependent hydrolase involved in phosphonate metabolism [Caenispirillum salinarum AK4]|uniref:Metal-dependent hydrolase involved in phosphonate metabolism n=1 Tax=Caenispirillum salinarum AK4 TaxID=1238182 RepID=K9HKM4_9PROT|nr:alpha-D-ribose 1-methylphosphonate 5-triphosphate diphosphatase [Caenispirillum salinarum]EKV30933.1 Metal-dependent hydrolase involved in phosphonate metabolism [Caenispirillum salinarum AK4]
MPRDSQTAKTTDNTTTAEANRSMNSEMILTNARVVCRDRVIDSGTVVVRDGRIAEVAEGRSEAAGALDLNGDYLLPGLIEMHTDNMEKHFVPRPGVLWPSPLAAVLGHDLQVAGAGITTVFDAISVGEYAEKGPRRQILGQSLAAVKHALSEGLCKADHLFHLRCEVSDPCVVEMFEPYAHDPLVRLVSLMDHTPGQRQWTDVSKYVQYNKGENWTEEELKRRIERLKAEQDKYAAKHRKAVVALAKEYDIPLASHDDATEDHVHEAVADGVVISEFPITMTAACLAREHGQKTIMGAPNVVRGGSHSGNMSALECAREGQLDGLSSDYVPSSLLFAAFLLHEKLDLPLHEAVAKVSANVADMVGLADRGRVETALRADLVRVTHTEHTPVVREVWVMGERVC